jgi:hypothetical protein
MVVGGPIGYIESLLDTYRRLHIPCLLSSGSVIFLLLMAHLLRKRVLRANLGE